MKNVYRGIVLLSPSVEGLFLLGEGLVEVAQDLNEGLACINTCGSYEAGQHA